MMENEHLYKKLEDIDTKLDRHMLNVENRVTALEHHQKSVAGQIKLILGLLASVASGIIVYIVRIFISPNP